MTGVQTCALPISGEISFDSTEDFEKLILAYDYSTKMNSKYTVVSEETEMVEKDGYRYPALKFIRRAL